MQSDPHQVKLYVTLSDVNLSLLATNISLKLVKTLTYLHCKHWSFLPTLYFALFLAGTAGVSGFPLSRTVNIFKGSVGKLETVLKNYLCV